MTQSTAEPLTPEPNQDPQPTAPAQPDPKPAEKPAEPTAPEWDGKVESLPPAAQKLIRDLRKEDGDERVAKKTLDAIQKALNPDAKPEEKADPAQLVQQLSDKDDTIRKLTVERALDKAARRAGADEDLLDAVLARKGSLKQLDPSDKDFTKKLDALVKTELDANPKLRAAQVAGSSGADFNGGSGEGAVTQAKFDAMSPAEKNRLFNTNPSLYRTLSGR